MVCKRCGYEKNTTINTIPHEYCGRCYDKWFMSQFGLDIKSIDGMEQKKDE
jgi:hypothetical protein